VANDRGHNTNMYKYDDAISLLIDRFPELKSTYEENIDDYEYLPYVFYESIFTKFVLKIIRSKETKKTKEIFTTVEDFMQNGDNEFRNLIDVAIIESLYFEEDYSIFSKEISQFYGKLTEQSFNDCFK
jgi:hypothetical protein